MKTRQHQQLQLLSEGMGAASSPDGRWIAFPSDESGEFEVYVARFPADPASRKRVSVAGGRTARWGAGGRELFYFEPESGRLIAVPLTFTGNRVQVGTARALFEVRPTAPWAMWYDVTRDGQRFIVNTPVEQGAPPLLSLVVNWPALLER
jgi:hypothetical protein